MLTVTTVAPEREAATQGWDERVPRLDLDPYDDAALTPGGCGEQVFAAEQAGEIPPGTASPVTRTLERLPLRVSLN